MKGLNKYLILSLFFVLAVVSYVALQDTTEQTAREVSLTEYATGALPILKEFNSPPTLIYLSGDPLLKPAPESLETDINSLLQNSSRNDFDRKGSPRSAELLILQNQTVRVALQHDVVEQVTWVPPTQTAEETISLEFLRNALVNNGSLSDVESATFSTAADNSLSGQINSHPFKVTTIHNLPVNDSPSLVMIDLSYFLSIYEDEIKTPIFPMVHTIINNLLTKNPGIEKFVISYSTGYGDVPLQLRFLGPVLATLAADPTLLDQPSPTNWRRLSKNIYMLNFHQVEEIWENALLMTKTEPNNPAWHYNLYESYNLLKMPKKALTALDSAARIDPGYTLEILGMARERLRNNDYLAGIELLTRAHDLSVEQEFIKLDLAIAHLQAGNIKKALSIVDELEKLSWSPTYFPNIPATLERIKSEASAKQLLSEPNSLHIPDLLHPSEEKE